MKVVIVKKYLVLTVLIAIVFLMTACTSTGGAIKTASVNDDVNSLVLEAAIVKIDSDPTGATVVLRQVKSPNSIKTESTSNTVEAIDPLYENKAKTPAKFTDVPPGVYEVHVSLPGHESIVDRMEIIAGERYNERYLIIPINETNETGVSPVITSLSIPEEYAHNYNARIDGAATDADGDLVMLTLRESFDSGQWSTIDTAQCSGAACSLSQWVGRDEFGEYRYELRAVDSNGYFDTEILVVDYLENETSNCTDTDGGHNYGVQGTVTATNGSGTDYCNWNNVSVVEYFCGNDGGLLGEHQYCEEFMTGSFCLNGACVVNATPTNEPPELQQFLVNPAGVTDEPDSTVVVRVYDVDGNLDRIVFHTDFLPFGGGSGHGSASQSSCADSDGYTCWLNMTVHREESGNYIYSVIAFDTMNGNVTAPEVPVQYNGSVNENTAPEITGFLVDPFGLTNESSSLIQANAEDINGDLTFIYFEMSYDQGAWQIIRTRGCGGVQACSDEYTHERAQSGEYRYRLRVVDAEGNNVISGFMTVNYEEITTAYLYELFAPTQELNDLWGSYLGNDQFAILADQEPIVIQGQNTVYSENIFFSSNSGNASVETGLTFGMTDDWMTNVFVTMLRRSMEYRLSFPSSLPAGVTIDNASSSNPINLPFLGRNLRITGATATSLTVVLAPEFLLYTGETAIVEGHNITLINVASNSDTVVVNVDGIFETVSGTETVNGLRVRVIETYWHQNLAARYAILAIGQDVTKTYNDNDEFIGQDEDNPVWRWNLANLNTGYPTLGVEWALGLDSPDESDNPQAHTHPIYPGEAYQFPWSFAELRFNGLTIQDDYFRDYKVETSTEDLFDAPVNTTPRYSSANVIKISVVDASNSGLQTQAHMTDTIYLFPYDSSHVAIYYSDPSTSRAVFSEYREIGGFSNGYLFLLRPGWGSHVTVMASNVVQGNSSNNLTHRYDMRFNFAVNDDLYVTAIANNYAYQYLGETNDDTDNGLYWRGFSRTAASATAVNTTINIAAWEDDTRTAYGTIVRDPDAIFRHSGGELRFSVPQQQLQAILTLQN